MRSRADVFVYEPFSQGPVVISHQRTENREPKVTVSLLLDQHVMAVYWLWESGEGQRLFRRCGVWGDSARTRCDFIESTWTRQRPSSQYFKHWLFPLAGRHPRTERRLSAQVVWRNRAWGRLPWPSTQWFFNHSSKSNFNMCLPQLYLWNAAPSTKATAKT